jgi:hypothetical protein
MHICIRHEIWARDLWGPHLSPNGKGRATDRTWDVPPVPPEISRIIANTSILIKAIAVYNNMLCW